MLDVFLDVVLPVIIVALLGGAVGRWRGITVPPLSGLVFYLFGPALVFDSMSKTELSAELGLKISATKGVGHPLDRASKGGDVPARKRGTGLAVDDEVRSAANRIA